MKLYENRPYSLRLTKKKFIRYYKEKKGSIPNCNNISIVNIKLIRSILLLQKYVF